MAQSFVHVHLVALRYFAETVRTGSMRQAAEVLSIAPSAVNRQILKLENQLQVKLFDRVTDGVRMTAAGEVLYRYIRNLERDLEVAIEHIDGMRGINRGHVRVASEDGIARDFLTAELRAFSERYPRITFSIAISPAIQVLETLALGEVDIGLAMNPPQRSDLRLSGSIDIPQGVIMPPGHPLSDRETLRLADLAGERMILGATGYGGGETINRLLLEGGRHRPFIESNSSDNIVTLVEQGLGCAIRSPVGVMDKLARRDLAFVPLGGGEMGNVRLCLWTHPTRSPSHAASVLSAQLEAALGDFGAKLDRWRVDVAKSAT